MGISWKIVLPEGCASQKTELSGQLWHGTLWGSINPGVAVSALPTSSYRNCGALSLSRGLRQLLWAPLWVQDLDAGLIAQCKVAFSAQGW